jgi:hypothetical protein
MFRWSGISEYQSPWNSWGQISLKQTLPTNHERPHHLFVTKDRLQFSFLTTVNRIRSFQTCFAYFIHSFAFAFSVTTLFQEDDSNHHPDKVPTTTPPHAWDPSCRSHCPRRLRSRYNRFRSRRSSICASTKVQS